MTMGCYAEYVAVARQTPLAIKPKNLIFQEAAALVFGGHTALHYLKKAEVKSGDSILIYGASGAVGTSAVQLAKYYGADITAVTSSGNMELIKHLGAGVVLDYTEDDLGGLDGVFDVVYETVDKTKVSSVAKLVKPGGKLLLGAALIKGMLQGLIVSKKYNLKLIVGEAKVTSKDIQFLAELAEQGELKPVIDNTYSFEQMQAAHGYVDLGHKKGSVVVEIG
jgi:NADPH:quinone reductase-like Zn-dependent oxidoreductase